MATEFTEYTTTHDQRWDTVAYRVYGDAKRIDDIIEANPGIPVTPVIPAGTTLRIPVKAAGKLNSALLPPWRR